MMMTFFLPSGLSMPFRGPGKPLVSVLRLNGVIGQGGGPMSRGLCLSGLAATIEKAFAPKKQSAVALLVNSPGGSPVQSAMIARRIRDLAVEKKVPVFAFCEDVAASGGYWLACAADEIFADSASVVGSIGVVSQSFGLHELIERHGVERRIHTAGDRKVLLDPFQAERPGDVERLNDLLQDVHDDFKSYVRDRRAGRLQAPESELFSGAFWTGRRALQLGLIDGIGHLRPVLRERFGEKVQLRVVNSERGWRRVLPRSQTNESRWADAAVGAIIASIEERALWSRYGL